MILNLACGNNKIKDAVNIDFVEGMGDVQCDIRCLKEKYQDGTVEKIYFFHAIEHLPKPFHFKLLCDLWDLLQLNGRLIVSYPEFEVTSKYWRENFRGQRDFWELTIYGRQTHNGEFHVALMHTPSFVAMLEQVGFKDFQIYTEPQHEYNSVVKCIKGNKPKSKEQIYREVLFS